MYRRRQRRLWQWLLCGVGGVLLILPDGWTAPLREVVRDALVPGLSLTTIARDAVRDRGIAWFENLRTLARNSRDAELTQRIGELEAELEQWKLRTRRERLQRLQDQQHTKELTRYGSSPGVSDVGLPLVELELLECRVLGEESSTLWRSGKLIHGGTQQGIEESALVLDSPLPLIDQGEDRELAVGLPVFAGRCVVGRIVKVGRWTSTVQPVTDRHFRGGLAQLCRDSGDGPLWGTVGMIEGIGDGTGLCRLTAVPATEAVEVGDHVYTAIEDGVLPGGMYYGEVVRAELNVGNPHWEIDVRPAADVSRLKRVQVLKRIENPQRRLAN